MTIAMPRLAYDVDVWFGNGPGWGDDPPVLPNGWWLGAASGVASSPDGEVYVCQRGQAADPILVYDRDGRFLRSFGRGTVGEAHGLRRDPDGDLWLTDTGLHQVHHFRPDGTLVGSWGRRGEPGEDETRFNLPTDVAFGPDGTRYVSDGYGNSRVIAFAPDGSMRFQWGRHGPAPGEFDTPHSLACSADGRVFVCDRSNVRLQVFAPDGTFLREWRPVVGAPQAVTFAPDGSCWLANAIDSIAGRVVQLDPASFQVLGTLESPGHMLDVTPWGDLLLAALSGSVLRWTASPMPERQ